MRGPRPGHDCDDRQFPRVRQRSRPPRGAPPRAPESRPHLNCGPRRPTFIPELLASAHLDQAVTRLTWRDENGARSFPPGRTTPTKRSGVHESGDTPQTDDPLFEQKLRRRLGGRLPEAAFRAALENLEAFRRREPIRNEAGVVVRQLQRAFDRGHYRSSSRYWSPPKP